jgi:MtaA/CmuA family methyltransferase
MNSRERVLEHLAGRPVDHLPLMPITMMFAADRIGVSYLEYVTDYRQLAAGQLRVAEEFGFDYVSCISDPAREAADLGAKVRYFPDQPPGFEEHNALLADKGTLLKLAVVDPVAGRRMSDRVSAAAFLRERAGADLLVEGWIEGPCAEGADLRGINTLLTDFYDDPGFVRDLFEFAVAQALRFAAAQVAVGVDIMGVGDAAASLVGPRLYREFVWPYEKKLVDGLLALGTQVRLHICGNTRSLTPLMGQLGCAIVDLDYPVPLAEARQRVGPDQVLLGNLDPVRAVRDASPDSIVDALGVCHSAAGARYILGAGCELPRDTPAENVRAFAAYAAGHRPEEFLVA